MPQSAFERCGDTVYNMCVCVCMYIYRQSVYTYGER